MTFAMFYAWLCSPDSFVFMVGLLLVLVGMWFVLLGWALCLTRYSCCVTEDTLDLIIRGLR